MLPYWMSCSARSLADSWNKAVFMKGGMDQCSLGISSRDDGLAYVPSFDLKTEELCHTVIAFRFCHSLCFLLE